MKSLVHQVSHPTKPTTRASARAVGSAKIINLFNLYNRLDIKKLLHNQICYEVIFMMH